MGYGEEELINGWYKEAAANLERWLDGKELQVRLN
jgi:glycerate dehydrogenase